MPIIQNRNVENSVDFFVGFCFIRSFWRFFLVVVVVGMSDIMIWQMEFCLQINLNANTYSVGFLVPPNALINTILQIADIFFCRVRILPQHRVQTVKIANALTHPTSSNVIIKTLSNCAIYSTNAHFVECRIWTVALAKNAEKRKKRTKTCQHLKSLLYAIA